MASPILDRVATPTIIWLLFAAGVWSLRERIPEYVTLGLIGLTGLYTFYSNVKGVDKELRISSLGSRAPRMRWYGPYNIGFVAFALWSNSKHKNHESWIHWFKLGGKQIGQQYANTVEAILVGERIVLTADDENIKAILATQFSDYGKGAPFNEEWRPFLGHSMCPTL